LKNAPLAGAFSCPGAAGEGSAARGVGGDDILEFGERRGTQRRQSRVDEFKVAVRQGQLQPVADAILPFVGDDFASLIDGQLGLF